MKRVIKNNYKIIIAFILGLIISGTTVYAVDAYIESNKVAYNNHNKTNVEEAIDELYEKSGIHKSKWVDPILNGADPVLKSPLIPVEIKDNGEAYYANENSEWYNYKKKRWANAVILIDEPSNANYQVGDHIIEDDIESYFVWIPRYQYKVWDLGKYSNVIAVSSMKNVQDQNDTSYHKLFVNYRTIDIKFGNVENTPKMTEPSTTGVYYTHPAFTLGDKNLNGIWIGKFETGGTNASDIIIKPNVTSWRNETVRTFFDAAKQYKRDLDSHMIKNIEWGAVAYLSHSAYGINTKVNINNTSDYITGYSAAPGTNQTKVPGENGLSTDPQIAQAYNTEAGYLASTTGNITGVYDMSGGAAEYVAACVENTLNISASGFTLDLLNAEVTAGYIDKYASDSTTYTYDKRILGDATGELGPYYEYIDSDGGNRYHDSWYYDYASFINPSQPWPARGCNHDCGTLASQFAFGTSPGSKLNNVATRLILAPINN